MSESLYTWLQNQGPAWVILFLVGLGFWRICLWLAPRGDRVLNSHCGLIETLQKNATETTLVISEIKDCLKSLVSQNSQILEHVEPKR